MRKNDILGRLGGEEFAVLITDVTAQTALQRAESLRHAVEKLVVPVKDQKAIQFTVSLGVFCMTNEHSTNVETCLERADAAMYFSKIMVETKQPCGPWRFPIIRDRNLLEYVI